MEVGFILNVQKCGVYKQNMNEEDDEDIYYLPLLTRGL